MSSKEILSARGGGRVPGQAAPLDRPRWGTVQAGSGRLGYLAVLVACAFLGPVFPWSGLDLSWFGGGRRLEGAEKEAVRFDVGIVFTGNQEISGLDLQRALNALRVDLAGTGVTEGAADDAAYETARYYRSLGFADATAAAEWSVSRRNEDGSAAGFEIRLNVLEGVQSFVEGVTITGNEHILLQELQRCFAWKKSGSWGMGPAIYTPEALQAAVACVRRKCQYEGYVFADVTHEVFKTETGRFRVAVEVNEGPRIDVLEAPKVEGADALSAHEIETALALQLPAAFTPRLPIVLKGRLLEAFLRRGYLGAEVEAGRKVDREAGRADLTLRVRAGPRVTIEAVRIHGNEKTDDPAVRQRLRLKAGDVYNEAFVRESSASLFRSGLFRSVRLDAVPLEADPERAFLDVHLKEKPQYRVSLLGGYGSYETLRGGASFENINVAGSGHRLRFDGTASLRGEGTSAEYINPFFFNERVSQNVKAYYSRREHPSFEGTEFGGETGLSLRVSEHVRSGVSYRLRQSQSDDVDPDVPPELVDDSLISSVELATVLDFRDSALEPSHGWTARFTLEYSGEALGSELDFVRPKALFTWVQPLGEFVQLLTSIRIGAVAPLGATDDIPIQERFYLGGESTIRSFEQDEAGPLIRGDPVGGEAFTSYSVEARFPIFRQLKGAVFWDTGTLNIDYEDIGGGRYFHALGTGLRYRTPVGPLRLDLAVNPEPQRREDWVEVHFALGYPF